MPDFIPRPDPKKNEDHVIKRLEESIEALSIAVRLLGEKDIQLYAAEEQFSALRVRHRRVADESALLATRFADALNDNQKLLDERNEAYAKFNKLDERYTEAKNSCDVLREQLAGTTDECVKLRTHLRSLMQAAYGLPDLANLIADIKREHEGL